MCFHIHIWRGPLFFYYCVNGCMSPFKIIDDCGYLFKICDFNLVFRKTLVFIYYSALCIARFILQYSGPSLMRPPLGNAKSGFIIGVAAREGELQKTHMSHRI